MEVKDIEIDYLSFQFMSDDKELKGLRKGGTSDYDTKSHLAYAKFLHSIATESDSKNCYDIFKPVSGGFGESKKELDAVKNLNVPDDLKQIETCTFKLASLLKENERNSVPGVFFLVLFRYKGIRYASVLKLDIFSEQWTSYEEKTSKMTHNEVIGELPGSDAKFRKGSIYPHPEKSHDTYMRVYQKDNPSRYFDSFLGGERRMRAGVMMTELRDLSRKISGEWPNYDVTIGLHNGLRSQVGKTSSMIDKASMTSIISAAIPSHTAKVKDVVEKTAKKWGLIESDDVLNVHMEIQFGDIILKGPISEFGVKFKHMVGGSKTRHQIEAAITSLKMVKKIN